MNIGKGFKDARKENKVSQFNLFKDSGLTITSIVNLENNHTFPRELTLRKISDSLKITPDYLLLLSIEDTSVLEEDKIAFEIYFKNLKKLMKKFNDTLNGKD